MEEIQSVREYQQGFNEGYVIAQHLPDLSHKISEAVGNSLRGTGFQDGRKQFIIEQTRNQYPAWLQENRLSSLDKEIDTHEEKDKDEFERE